MSGDAPAGEDHRTATRSMDPPELPAADLPALTADQMREVDRIMVQDLGIELIQMMENAGARLSDLALRRFRPRSAQVLVGAGGNGGGGLVAARHLANRGIAVRVAVGAEEGSFAPVPAHQLEIVRRMAIPVGDSPEAAELVVDALLGYSLKGDPRGRTADLIRWASAVEAPILALDTPSGLDVTTGRVGDPCIRATATMTLALPKRGLLTALEQVGELYLADISVPPGVYDALGLRAPSPFRDGPLVRLLG